MLMVDFTLSTCCPALCRQAGLGAWVPPPQEVEHGPAADRLHLTMASSRHMLLVK